MADPEILSGHVFSNTLESNFQNDVITNQSLTIYLDQGDMPAKQSRLCEPKTFGDTVNSSTLVNNGAPL